MPGAPLTPREAWTLGAAGVVYAAAIVVLRSGHGGDIVPEIALSERWLDGESLYGVVRPTQGTLWPPFAAVALVPFALLARASLPAATAAWSVLSVACLVLAVGLARRRVGAWRPVVLALLATAVPIQTNFEHRNVNTLLLALVVAAGADLEDRRDVRAGVWLGLAAALKAFPALLLVYLVVRRRGRALSSAVLVAGGVTLIALAPYGVTGGAAAVGDWLGVGLDQGQWQQLSASDQSLRALVVRLGGGETLALTAALAVAAVGVALGSLGAATLAAVLAAPIAWVHYYVLAFPAWLGAFRVPGDPFRGARGVFLALAAIATSGWLTVGPRPLRQALLAGSIYAWGGLAVVALLAPLAWRSR